MGGGGEEAEEVVEGEEAEEELHQLRVIGELQQEQVLLQSAGKVTHHAPT